MNSPLSDDASRAQQPNGLADGTATPHGAGGSALLSALAAAIDEPVGGAAAPAPTQLAPNQWAPPAPTTWAPDPSAPPPPLPAPPVTRPAAPASPMAAAPGATDWLPADTGPARWRPPATGASPVPDVSGLGTWRLQEPGVRPALDAPAGPALPPAMPSPVIPTIGAVDAVAEHAPTPMRTRVPGSSIRQLPPPPPAAAGPVSRPSAPPPPFRAPGAASAPPPPFRPGGESTSQPLPVVDSTASIVDQLLDNDGQPGDVDDVKERAQNSLLEGLGARLYDPSMTEETMNDLVATHLDAFFATESIELSPDERERLGREITDDLLRHGPIEPLLADPSVNEIMVNGCRQIYIERRGKLVLTRTQFRDDAQLRRVIERIVGRVGRRIDESSPMVDARLPDGSRVNAIIPPLAVDGPTLTIRKFTADGFTIDDLIRTRSVTPEVAGLIEVCVRGRLNILVSGGTGSGKTTLLNILSSFIPTDERIVTIEDAVELRLRQPHVIRLESRPANVEGKGAVLIRDLVRNSLRMRPDRVVVGECRGGETLDMLQAMNTGHDGSLSTLHANSPRDALSRIETMVLMAGMDLPVRAIREQVASAVDLIVHTARLRDGSRRVTHLSEVVGMEGDTITMNDVFVLSEYGEMDEQGLFTGSIKSTGIRPLFADRLADHGIHVPEELFGETYGLRLGGNKAAGGW